ncbi:hypothetical protein B0H10DRAFT_446921 [Mycena sp. CBHHK59/15]|nr:hypothetical protein B0H10DRAFT_446921 [Mycena sp. CBHHK59/15]
MSQTSDFRRREDSLRNISSYDWHEGASSIDVDATEHSLLSTSFITSLLRENPDPTGIRSHRTSIASDFSEMTYPPVRTQISMRSPPSQRPQGGRPPPTSFQPIPESSVLASDDDTLYSNHDPIVGTTSVARPLRGNHVVGVASATLRNIKSVSDAPSYGKDELDLDYTQHDSIPYSPALPSTAGLQTRFLPPTSAEVRQSMHSTRSHAPSFMSSSSKSLKKIFVWKKKPLPPVPKIAHIPVAEEAEFKQKEEATPLSQLLIRSDALRAALDNGQHPHHSFNSKAPGLMSAFEENSVMESFPNGQSPAMAHWGQAPTGPSSPQIKADRSKLKNRRIWIILGVFIVVAIAAVAAAVAVTLHNRRTEQSTSCSGNLVGAACNLDATCVCTSLLANRCDGLAQNIVTLTPMMNRLFDTNFSTNDVYVWIWTSQGTITAKNCAAQAVLVDVGVTLASQNFPNRTQWAQSALLWDLQSLNTTGLQQFAVDAPWSMLSVDGPTNVSNASLFSTSASGYEFNFAAQTVTPPSISFLTDGTPTSAQAGEVSNTLPLDRMYTFAAASSTQYQGLLQSYWVTNLQRTLDKLPVFMSLLRASPILIPFDVESSSVRSLLTSSSVFPPPIACYPGLTATQLQQINELEGVFGLSQASSATQFDTSCFPNRPVYGVLDILRLQLPFADSRTNVARQAVALHSDVGPRAVIYSGEVLSAFPGTSNISAQGISLDPNTYGTLDHFNHVVLQFLSSMPTIAASAVVDYVLSNSTSPPPSSSLLASTTIPSLEVAIFGTLTKSDISFVASGFADASGSLVFGSSDGDTLRQWAIPETGNLVWTEFGNSSLVVHDTSFTDAIFNQTWAAAAAALSSNAKVGVSNITNSFELTGKFSS